MWKISNKKEYIFKNYKKLTLLPMFFLKMILANNFKYLKIEYKKFLLLKKNKDILIYIKMHFS